MGRAALAGRGGGLVDSETVVDGETLYTRFADHEGAGDLEDEKWQRYENEPLTREEMLDGFGSSNAR